MVPHGYGFFYRIRDDRWADLLEIMNSVWGVQSQVVLSTQNLQGCVNPFQSTLFSNSKSYWKNSKIFFLCVYIFLMFDWWGSNLLNSQTLFCAARSSFGHIHSCFFFFLFFWRQDCNFHLSVEVLPSHRRCYTLQQLLQLPARDAPPGNHISSIGGLAIRQTSQTHEPFTWNITANTIYSPSVRSLTVSLSDVCSQHKSMQLYLYPSFCANYVPNFL